MTNEEMDRAIAEAVGWTRIWDPAFRQWTQRSPDGCNVTCDPDPDSGWDMSRVPRFSIDLNAMHEAEKTLTGEQYLNYTLLLMDDYQTIGCVSRHSSATAEDRAINFLRTIGKYSDASATLP